MVAELVRAGARVDEVNRAEGLTPLGVAVAAGHAEVVKALLEHNADPNMTASATGSDQPGKNTSSHPNEVQKV